MSIEQRLAEIEERVNVSERIFPTTNVVFNNELRFLLALAKRYREALNDISENYDCDTDAHKYTTGCRSCIAKAALAYTPEEPK